MFSPVCLLQKDFVSYNNSGVDRLITSIALHSVLLPSQLIFADPVDSVNFLAIGGYVAKESVNDVAIGDNLSHEQRAEFMDLL